MKNKKNLLIILLCCTCLLIGCKNREIAKTGGGDEKAAEETNSVQNQNQKRYMEQEEIAAYMIARSQYKDGVYTILVQFLDEKEKAIWLAADIDILIINSKEELYSGNISIDEKNFSTWNSKLYGDEYLCGIEISEKDIKKSSEEKGTVVLKVVGKGYQFLMFDYSFEIDGLPHISPADLCALIVPEIPAEIIEYNWNDEVSARLTIDKIEYEFQESYTGPCKLILRFSGEKTYDKNPDHHSYFTFQYRILDSDGYVVDTGSVLTDRLGVGDKFRNKEETIYGLEAGHYILEIVNSD